MCKNISEFPKEINKDSYIVTPRLRTKKYTVILASQNNFIGYNVYLSNQ